MISDAELLRQIQEAVWDEGYEAAVRDARRTGMPDFHTSDCDCHVPTQNPYEQ